MKTPKIIALACTVTESMMHGAAYFKLNGNHLTAVYTDGTEETARVTAQTREKIRAYHRYQNENGPEVEVPNTFHLVSEIQSARSA